MKAEKKRQDFVWFFSFDFLFGCAKHKYTQFICISINSHWVNALKRNKILNRNACGWRCCSDGCLQLVISIFIGERVSEQTGIICHCQRESMSACSCYWLLFFCRSILSVVAVSLTIFFLSLLLVFASFLWFRSVLFQSKLNGFERLFQLRLIS